MALSITDLGAWQHDFFFFFLATGKDYIKLVVKSNGRVDFAY
jgi:hypothetical protein